MYRFLVPGWSAKPVVSAYDRIMGAHTISTPSSSWLSRSTSSAQPGSQGPSSTSPAPQSATAGLEETIAYYNSAESIEGQWLAFIADSDGRIVAHSDLKMLGTDLQDLFGAAASRATADGSWITTDDIDPSTGGPESMRVWMVTHDGMTFGAGWYNDGTG